MEGVSILYIIWFATNSFHFGQADLKIHHLVCRQFVPLWPSGLEDTSSGLPPIRSTQKMRKGKNGVDWIHQTQRCTSDFHTCPNRRRSGHDTKSGQRDSSLVTLSWPIPQNDCGLLAIPTYLGKCQVTAFDKSLSAINCSARPDISRCMNFVLVRESKATASSGPVSRRISARSF
ncbi:hypothetical protein T01_4998 [Trichinella spiralis]|uniref:Uncharacterized protein n=1 Tax=Trichinella spiralis TaxID=6334 RepID=A0A0V1B958_TRISP|nr:hypothetical protein T01_4998 [Trichinella spiralis]